MRVPPFTALKALEAAARLRSYSKAAVELSVTHGAISQQIRGLEEAFGAELFVRRGNGMEADGLRRCGSPAKVQQAITALEAGVAEFVDEAERDPLVISAETQFAAVWLRPRLARIREGSGETPLELRVDDQLANLKRDGVDGAVRYGRGPWPGLETKELLEDRLILLCSPEFFARHPLDGPRSLAGVPLLRHSSWPWSLWTGTSAPELEDAGLVFDNSSMLLDAAAQGLGMALARSALAVDDLRSGRLIQPFPDAIALESRYVFVWRADASRLSRVLRFRDWLLFETGRADAERLAAGS